VPNSAGTEPPKLAAPANAADCHIHIYDPRFAPPVTKPLNGAVQDYRLLQKRLGVSRVVIVQPRNYATDNSATLDAIRQLGIASARGVAVIRPTVTDAELKTLDDGGIRGIRFTVGNPKTAVVSIDMIEPLAQRIAQLGWHVQLNMPAEKIVEHADLLRRLPTQIVFDHMAQLLPAGLEHPAYRVIRRLIDGHQAWVKISGANLNTSVGPPTYADATTVAQAYVKAAPERCVWGSDWPHPSAGDNPPDDAVLFNLLSAWAPEEAPRNRILVTNPQALYGFPA
jgi:predicted TIM-barrel fold metal-dependent hydrolase